MATTLARIVLGVVFGVAGITKLGDRGGVAATARTLGVPTRLAATLGLALPVIELGVAASMAWTPATVAGASVGLFLLVSFTCLVALDLKRGRRTTCHCFGQVRSAPIGAGTLARNLVLTGLAAVVLLGA